MLKNNNKIQNWIFDLDNTLYSADTGVFQQIHVLMGKFISEYLNIEIKKAKKIQESYYKNHGTTLRGLMDNYDIDPELFLNAVHKLDYSIVMPNKKLKNTLLNLQGKKIIYTNANKKHAVDILQRLQITNIFDVIFDIKMANYIPKPEIEPYEKLIEMYNIDPKESIMFDDIAKNLVPASKLGFTTVWINVGYENFSDDITKSKKYLDYETKNLPKWLEFNT